MIKDNKINSPITFKTVTKLNDLIESINEKNVDDLLTISSGGCIFEWEKDKTLVCFDLSYDYANNFIKSANVTHMYNINNFDLFNLKDIVYLVKNHISYIIQEILITDSYKLFKEKLILFEDVDYLNKYNIFFDILNSLHSSFYKKYLSDAEICEISDWIINNKKEFNKIDHSKNISNLMFYKMYPYFKKECYYILSDYLGFNSGSLDYNIINKHLIINFANVLFDFKLNSTLTGLKLCDAYDLFLSYNSLKFKGINIKISNPNFNVNKVKYILNNCDKLYVNDVLITTKNIKSTKKLIFSN